MKATTILAILSLMTVHALGQGSIDEALKTIESNNNDIKAAKALYEARSMEARAANTLGDTSVEYEKMFDLCHARQGHKATGQQLHAAI